LPRTASEDRAEQWRVDAAYWHARISPREAAALPEAPEVGFGRILALQYPSATLYQQMP
jgi:hypothetical protein